MDLPLRWTSRTTCSASFGLFRFPIFDFIGLDVRLLTGLPPRRTYWAIRPAQYMLKLFLLQIPAVSTSGGCFTRCRPCSFFRYLYYLDRHTPLSVSSRQDRTTTLASCIRHRHRAHEQVVLVGPLVYSAVHLIKGIELCVRKTEGLSRGP